MGYPSMQKTFTDELSRHRNERIRKVLYLERKITTTRMMELPGYEKNFKQYRFEWMMRAPEKYNDVLLREIYIAYKGELKRQRLFGDAVRYFPMHYWHIVVWTGLSAVSEH